MYTFRSSNRSSGLGLVETQTHDAYNMMISCISAMAHTKVSLKIHK